jgi:hypothetical protein
MRPISRPSMTSAVERTVSCDARPSRTISRTTSRLGRDEMASTSAGKSAIASPSTAVTRSPGRNPATSAGPPASTLPISAGTGGVQNRIPRPGNKPCGSVNARRTAASSTRSSSTRTPEPGRRTSMSTLPSSLMASMKPSITSECVAMLRPSMRTNSSLVRRSARAASESATTRPTTGFTCGSPLTQSTAQSTRMANAMLNAGPASNTRMRCHGCLRVNERSRSAGGTGPSRSSSNLT